MFYVEPTAMKEPVTPRLRGRELYDALVEAAKFSSFGESLLSQYNAGRTLSEKQVDALSNMIAKRNNKAKQPVEGIDVNLSPIQQMFETAQAAGLSKLAYRAEGLVLSLAKPNSANPGAIYVKTRDGEYLGKVLNNKFIATNAATDEHKRSLDVIAINPSQAAKNYGKKVGECSCCGLELTNPESIAAGIGPICATKWGL